MINKYALPILACMLLSVVGVQSVTYQSTSASPAAESSPTEEPTSTPITQTAPISPWMLMLAVFASVTLTALVLTGFQKLRARINKKP